MIGTIFSPEFLHAKVTRAAKAASANLEEVQHYPIPKRFDVYYPGHVFEISYHKAHYLPEFEITHRIRKVLKGD